MADLKSQTSDRASPPRVWFGPNQQQLPQHQKQHYQQPRKNDQQQQQQQQPYGNQQFVNQPALMWDQNMMLDDGRQSASWPPPQSAGEVAAATQLPQLLQKLQKTQEKLESRDASARKYKARP